MSDGVIVQIGLDDLYALKGSADVAQIYRRERDEAQRKLDAERIKGALFDVTYQHLKTVLKENVRSTPETDAARLFVSTTERKYKKELEVTA